MRNEAVCHGGLQVSVNQARNKISGFFRFGTT